MANLKSVAEKIKSVKNTGKITKAMKLVSTVKLRRAEELARMSKSYENALTNVLQEIAFIIEKYNINDTATNLLQSNKESNIVDIVFVTSDKGMCGSFNIKTIKSVLGLIDQFETEGKKVRLKGIGKKGVSYFSYRGYELLETLPSAHPDYKNAAQFIASSVEDFNKGIIGEVVLVHNGFKNMILQEMRTKQLLPLDIDNLEGVESDSMLDIEPDNAQEILSALIKKYVEFSTYFTMIDSLAAEHSSRMQAMETATKNAQDVTKKLTTQYNKARQSAVTNELIEIISGVEAMK